MRIEDILVRFAAHADLPLVQQDEYPPPEIIERKIERGEVLLAWCGERLLGFARFEYLWSRLPYLTLIQVLPEYQRRGVGQAIVAYLESHLRASGHTVLYSSSQDDEAEPQAWHRRMGFAECGLIEGMNPGGIGEVFFRKPLS